MTEKSHTPKNIDWDNQPLGDISDASLAKRLGVTRVAVLSARRRRGIPSRNGSDRERLQAIREIFEYVSGVCGDPCQASSSPGCSEPCRFVFDSQDTNGFPSFTCLWTRLDAALNGRKVFRKKKRSRECI